ncbi:MAG: hypothetical protein HQM09_01780 [Candidatus Riflebacteria bacterium]|nr:hypothetical protein [Candidatus Riflebacteria bacterium]
MKLSFLFRFPEERRIVFGVIIVLFLAVVYGLIDFFSNFPSGVSDMSGLSDRAGQSANATSIATTRSSFKNLSPQNFAALFDLPLEAPLPPIAPIASIASISATASKLASVPTKIASGSLGLATATIASRIASTSPRLSSAPAKIASETVKASISSTSQTIETPDLNALGYRLRGIIHGRRGRSTVFLFDPFRNKEVVVTSGASDSIKLVEVGERHVCIDTPKGKGILKLPDAVPILSGKTPATPTPIASPVPLPGQLPPGTPPGYAMPGNYPNRPPGQMPIQATNWPTGNPNIPPGMNPASMPDQLSGFYNRNVPGMGGPSYMGMSGNPQMPMPIPSNAGAGFTNPGMPGNFPPPSGNGYPSNYPPNQGQSPAISVNQYGTPQGYPPGGIPSGIGYPPGATAQPNQIIPGSSGRYPTPPPPSQPAPPPGTEKRMGKVVCKYPTQTIGNI